MCVLAKFCVGSDVWVVVGGGVVCGVVCVVCVVCVCCLCVVDCLGDDCLVCVCVCPCARFMLGVVGLA